MGSNDNPRRQRHRQPQQQWHPPRPSAAASPSAQTRDTKQRHALSSRVSADPRERVPASSQRRDLVPSDAPRRRSRNSPTSSPSREEPVTKRLALFSFQAIPHHTLPSCANCIE